MKSPDVIRGRGDLRTAGTLLPYLWPRATWDIRSRVVLALACVLASKIAAVFVPLLYKRAVDALSERVDVAIAVPVAVLIGYGLLRILATGFGELRDAVCAKVSQRAVRTLALAVFRHLHGLALAFHLDRRTGGLSRTIERGTKGIETVLTFTLFNILPTFIEIPLVCAILWSLYDVWYALVTFVTISFYIAYTLGVTEWRMRHRRAMNEMDNAANSTAVDSLLNYETVKYFGNEAHEAARYDSALRRYERAAVLSRTSLSILNVGQASIIAVGVTIIMIMAGTGVVGGTMTIGDFVLVNSYLVQLYLPLNFLGAAYREIKQSLADMEALFDLLDVPATVSDRTNAVPLAVREARVSFENVSFGYDSRRPILDDVSFEVPPGRMVAIVGASGAGKSTIGRLLFRFYDVEGGAIRIDGQDIRGVTQASLRKAIGVVPQDTVLFNDTVYYNIAYGRPAASQAEVETAARLAHIHDFILGLPDGYATRVGERGLKLSGGEKQRVAIARTILKAPPILLFDEATSSLDSHTEREIQENLREISAERTTIVIAHRLSTVVDADEILVLEAGRVVERGRHRDLLAGDGRYAALWRRQQESAGGGAETEEGGEIAHVRL